MRRSCDPALRFLLPEFTANGAAILERGKRDGRAAARGRPANTPGCPPRRLPRNGAASPAAGEREGGCSAGPPLLSGFGAAQLAKVN